MNLRIKLNFGNMSYSIIGGLIAMQPVFFIFWFKQTNDKDEEMEKERHYKEIQQESQTETQRGRKYMPGQNMSNVTPLL